MSIKTGSTAWVAQKTIAARKTLIEARENLIRAAEALILAEEDARQWDNELDGAVAADMALEKPDPDCEQCGGTGLDAGMAPCECLDRDDEAGGAPRGWTELDPGTVMSKPVPDPDCTRCGGDGEIPPGYARLQEICECVYRDEPREVVGDAGDDGAR